MVSRTAESRALLGTVLVGRVDETVRERILAEAHGNPLALMELPRTLTAAEMATGIVQGTRDSLTSRLEASYRRQLDALPKDTQRLLVLAAAEPLGDPLLLLRAASHLGIGVEAADAAEAAEPARDPRAGDVPAPARSLDGVSQRSRKRAAGGPRRVGGGDRSRSRPRPPGVAPGAGVGGAR